MKPQTRLSTSSGTLEIRTEVVTPYTSEEAWAVITDYDRLHRYMPNLRSRTLEQTDSAVIVEQTSSKNLVDFSCTLEFIRESAERLRFRQIAGPLRRFDGYWSVTPRRQGAHIFYNAEAEHGLRVPGMLVKAAVRPDIEKIMPAIVAELDRRAQTS